MKNCKYVIVLFYFLVILTGCDSEIIKEPDLPPFNPLIEAFTSGHISRYAPIRLVFAQAVPSNRIQKDHLSKLIKIKPYIAGSWTFQDNRTLVFKPERELERNAVYRVKVDLSDWFETNEENRVFSFGFATYPFVLRQQGRSLEINKKDKDAYDFTVTFVTPDKESSSDVESQIEISKEVDRAWSHSVDGKRHELRLIKVAADDNTFNILLSVAANRWGMREETISLEVPDRDDFSVYDINYVRDPEKYVEITFTKKLASNQEMWGLAYFSEAKKEQINVVGNKLRLYPGQAQEDKDELKVHLDKAIRSEDGKMLGEDVERLLYDLSCKPQVRFVNHSTILPSSDHLIVPFQAISLRAVKVNIIKILEQNIGRFLQENQLDGDGGLVRVGRLMACETIFLDDKGLDLSRWNTYAVDLKRLIEPEPGAIYRVELSFDRSLSVYPCGEDNEILTRQQIASRDREDFKEMNDNFDKGKYFYYRYDWSNYDWKKSEDPCSDSYYVNKHKGKNVLVTDLGLIAKRGLGGDIIVLVHDIRDARPEKGVTVTAYNYQGESLVSGATDAKGRVDLKIDKGNPFYLVASEGSQRSYLRVDEGSALSFSAFDVAGEVVQKGIKGFIYGERGVWRPGDTLYLSLMLSDRAKQLPKEYPVVMELYNPLGQSYARQIQTKGVLGLYAFQFVTEKDAPTGVWTLKANVGGVVFSKRIRIETIKPNRLKIALSMPDSCVLRGEPLNARLHVEWLQGAVARNLKYDIQGAFVAVPTVFKGYDGFVFDDPTRTFQVEESKLIEGEIDEKGDAQVKGRFELGNAAPGFLLANMVTRVYEKSGDFSLDAMRMLYSPYRCYVGLKSPQGNLPYLETGVDCIYEVASVDYHGKPLSSIPLEVNIYKVNWYWWWDASNANLANFVSSSYNKPIKRMQLRTDLNGKGMFRFSCAEQDWGTYLIIVKDLRGGHSTGVMSYFDKSGQEGRHEFGGSDAATELKIITDKESYAPGEKMLLSFASEVGSQAIVSIENGSRVLSVQEYICKKNVTDLKVDVTKEMQPNVYVHVTLLQPYERVQNDRPVRLYGIAPVTVTSSDSHLTPVIQMKSEIKPEASYSVSISEKRGREMAYTLAIVDEGLLDLTRFVVPDPWKVFNAHEALGVQTWDLYNYILGAYNYRIEQMFSIGGDDALEKGPKAIVNRFKPVVQFDGPFLLKQGESATHHYQMPNYSGRVKVMVVAGDGGAYGSAEKSVMVRKPIMLLGTLPRVVGVDEEMIVPVTVFAMEDGVGPIDVSLSCGSNMEVIGKSRKRVHMSRKGDVQISFRLRTKEKSGVEKVKVIATGKGDRSVYETDLEIRSVRRPQEKVKEITLEAGKSWKGQIEKIGEGKTSQLSLEFSRVLPLHLSSRVSSLLAYPHNCLEQLVSKAFAQLLLPGLMDLSQERSALAEDMVKETIRRLRSYQTSDGAFAYWPGSSDSNGWATVYAVHFLIKAEQSGFLISGALRRDLLRNMSSMARSWKPVEMAFKESEEITQAYRLYVLALAGVPELGAMNRLKENQRLTDCGRWLLGASYALIGREDVSRVLVAHTENMATSSDVYDQTFGSSLRDRSIRLITLCLLKRADEAALFVKELSRELSSEDWLSTQSTAFALIALSAYYERYQVDTLMDIEYTYKGRTNEINTESVVYSENLSGEAGNPVNLSLQNRGESTVFARIVTKGVPAQGMEKAYANKVKLSVRYMDMDGCPLSIEELERGVTFAAVVTVSNPTAIDMERLALTQIFPVGWEILNTRPLRMASADASVAGVNYQDIQDDRVLSYIDRLPAGRQVTVKINLCSVYPGRFYLPPVYCEAMYDHLIRANTEARQVVVR